MSAQADVGFKHLTDSLARLENLSTLHLGLHSHFEVARIPGPTGILRLTSLPNLETLKVPFHFVVQNLPEGQCKVSSPAHVLPHSLKSLTISACVRCLRCWLGKSLEAAPSIYQHQEAVLEFLEGLDDLCVKSFPGLRNICYQEIDVHSHCTRPCACATDYRRISHTLADLQQLRLQCAFHFNKGSDISRLETVSESLLRNSVELEKRAIDLRCHPC